MKAQVFIEKLFSKLESLVLSHKKLNFMKHFTFCQECIFAHNVLIFQEQNVDTKQY
jgi:hypothetical protein